MESDDAGDGFLETPVVDVQPAGEAELPRRIGPFEILGLLGRGGMGVVYRARQQEPSREVALKVINPGLLSEDAMARLRHEADTLARLRAPGIAQVFAVGSALLAGVEQPWFAMELIDGEPITRAAAHLDVRARLELLASACDAVQHAHARGVIHRDLKPANILVEGMPDAPRCRILDFGIALTRSPEADATLRVAAGLEGTLAYMSPEQLGEEPDIDTRADVYALGAVGFEVLSGEPHFASSTTSIAGAVRAAAESEPRRLSDLDPSLRGDIETIFLTALARDRDRRYESVAALASDIRAYLDDRPISARPASNAYVLRKWARRNRGVAAGVSVAVIAIALGVLLMAFGLIRAEREAEEKAREAVFAQGTADFYSKMLLGVDPAMGGADVSFMDLLDLAERRSATLVDQPRLEADVRQTLGFLFRRHGLHDRAESNLRRALELRRRVLAAGHGDTALSMHALCQVLHRYRGAYAEAESLVQEAIAVMEAEDHESLPWAHLDHALVRMELQEFEDAEVSVERAMAVVRARSGPDAVFLNLPLMFRAELRVRQGRYEEALADCEDALQRSPESIGQAYPRARILIRKAEAQRALGEADAALESIERALDGLLGLVSRDHPNVAEAEAVRCRVLLDLGRGEEALVAARACRRGREVSLHGDHWRQFEGRVLEARAQVASGDATGVPAEMEGLRAALSSRMGVTHPLMLESDRALLEAYEALGMRSSAELIRSRLERWGE